MSSRFYGLRPGVMAAVSIALAGCGKYYVHDESVTNALKAQEGVFRLDSVFGDDEWSHLCYIRDYQRASGPVAGEFGASAFKFNYRPRNLFMDENHVGLALVDLKSRRVAVTAIPRGVIDGFYGPPCLPRARAFASLTRHPNTRYGDRWSLTFSEVDSGGHDPRAEPCADRAEPVWQAPWRNTHGVGLIETAARNMKIELLTYDAAALAKGNDLESSANAIQHVFASALITYRADASTAIKRWDSPALHSEEGPHRFKDQWNNETGRRIGQWAKDHNLPEIAIDDLVIDAQSSGHLIEDERTDPRIPGNPSLASSGPTCPS